MPEGAWRRPWLHALALAALAACDPSRTTADGAGEAAAPPAPSGPATILLAGDTMLGRRIDAQLAADPALQLFREFEPWTADVDLLAVNLETTITTAEQEWPGKNYHFKMAPERAALAFGKLPVAAGMPIFVSLANNHTLDFGHRGLTDTLDTLVGARIVAVGAGRNANEAARPAAVTVAGGCRVVISSFGTQSSGIPLAWAAARDRAGVHLLPDLSVATADRVAGRLLHAKRPGDIAIASIHWGSNWGYEVPADEVGFAHRLIDCGVDLVHGHSSHHPRPIQVYRGKLIIYGCGDLVDDYEGIGGYEKYRDDLRMLYFASVEPATGRLIRLRMAPMQARQMRLRHTSAEDTEHLRSVLSGVCQRFGSRVELGPDGMLRLATVDR